MIGDRATHHASRTPNSGTSRSLSLTGPGRAVRASTRDWIRVSGELLAGGYRFDGWSSDFMVKCGAWAGCALCALRAISFDPISQT